MSEREPGKYGDEEVLKYANPENWELWPAPTREEVVYHQFPEFTCLCPRSGYPDFARVHLLEVPDEKVLELKVLKLWLNSYREKRISHEGATQEIFDTFWKTVQPKALMVMMEYTPRGNLTTFPTAFQAREGTMHPDTVQLLSTYQNQIVGNVLQRQMK